MIIKCVAKSRQIKVNGKTSVLNYGDELSIDDSISTAYIGLPYFEEVKKTKEKGDKTS